MTRKYRLEGRRPVEVDDLLEWAQAVERAAAAGEHIVARTAVEVPGCDPVMVSTVFLALDHGWGEGPPLLFETRVFGGPLDGETYRYSTWEEAEGGHAVLADEALVEDRLAAELVRDRLRAIARR